jgi:hypothetical protein
LDSAAHALSDPSGLFVTEAIDAYATIGLTAGTLAYMLTQTYADNLDHDLGWATDWNMPDEWHTRSDATWIDEIYRLVDIDGEVNDFALGTIGLGSTLAVGSAQSTWKTAARAWNKMGFVAHHILTHYKTTSKAMKTLLSNHGVQFNLWSMDNMLPLTKVAHGAGRHKKMYHDKILEYFANKLAGKYGLDAQKAFNQALNELKIDILRNPSKWFG